MLNESQIESIKVAHLEWGDVLMLKHQHVLSRDVADLIITNVRKLLPDGVRVMLLDPCLDVEVVRKVTVDAAEQAELLVSDLCNNGPISQAMQKHYGLRRVGR